MKDKPYSSQFTYSDTELETNKVIAFVQSEMVKMRQSGEQFDSKLDDYVARAEALARKKGITDTQLSLLRTQAENESGRQFIPEPALSWSETVDKANAIFPGYVTLEEICSADDFENAFRHIKEIEDEFKNKTKLTKTDLAFIVVAIALQCARQYVLQPFLDKHRLTHKQNDDIVKGTVKAITPKEWHEILLGSVPYDAVAKLDKEAESTGVSGSTHRYRTLGHDPLLGWLFGPMNILSDTLTKSDFITSYEVVDMKIGGKVFTGEAFERAYEQAKIRFNFPASIIKQAIHFGADYFSKQGLPIPIIGSVNNDVSQFLIRNNINALNVSLGIGLSVVINKLVSCVHGLFNTDGIDSKLYEVRTRKILSISNTIASASNIALVAITKNTKVLDLGGLLVTISRLCSDARFIARVKQEFIEGKLNDEWARISDDIDMLCGC